jgi:hypothetical protein
MARHRVLILGAGKRVKSDLLPVLTHLGFTNAEILIIRKSHEQLLDFPEFACAQFEPNLVKKFDPTLIISCLPTTCTVEVLQKVLEFTSPHNLFVDTPITKIYEDLNNLKIRGGINVLEDNHLVFFATQLRLSNEAPRAIFVLNALYEYHGVAMIYKIFGKLSHNHFKFRLRNFYFLIFKSGKTTIFWVGPRNYSKGRIYFLKRRLNKGILGKYEFEKSLIPEWTINYINKNLDFRESENILSADPVKFMPFWKRMALGEALHKFFSVGQNDFLKLDEALISEIYFQRFRKSSFKILLKTKDA